MNVTLSQLRAFERIVRLGSFRAAAQELRDEVRLTEVEGPEVEDLATAVRPLDQDGVVPELEEGVLVRAEGEDVDREEQRAREKVEDERPRLGDGPEEDWQQEVEGDASQLEPAVHPQRDHALEGKRVIGEHV